MNKKTFVTTFKRDDYDIAQLCDMSDAEVYVLAKNIKAATGDFAPLLPIGTWCDLLEHYSDAERRAYAATYLYYIISIPAEEA